MNSNLQIPNVQVKKRPTKNPNQTSQTKSSLLSSIRDNERTFTENMAATLPDTQNAVLDLFSLGGAARKQSEDQIIKLFSKALSEDELLAMKCLMYLGDIRGGQGERRLLRVILSWLGNNHPELIRKNLHLVSFYNRWDSLFALLNTYVEKDVFELIEKQIHEDWNNYKQNKPISLLAKWMKSLRTSSEDSRKIAEYTRQKLGWSEKKYRKTLSELRRHIDVVEKKMCSQMWNSIDYSKVPSRASMIYRKAFMRHDPEGYTNFLEKVKKGEAKIQSGVLYPYDLVSRARRENNDTLEEQWKNLPDYIGGEHQGLVLCDVSGSMDIPISEGTRAMDVSISLALYISERAKGKFHDSFITFSGNPKLQQIKGKSLHERINNLEDSEWGANTNIQKAFDLILQNAIKDNIPQSEMPEVLWLVSDMEFDRACPDNQQTNFEKIKEKFENAGYRMPLLCFWNCAARNQHAPVKFDERGVILVSGFSPSIFKHLLAQNFEDVTPLKMMMNTLNSERYEPVTV